MSERRKIKHQEIDRSHSDTHVILLHLLACRSPLDTLIVPNRYWSPFAEIHLQQHVHYTQHFTQSDGDSGHGLPVSKHGRAIAHAWFSGWFVKLQLYSCSDSLHLRIIYLHRCHYSDIEWD